MLIPIYIYNNLCRVLWIKPDDNNEYYLEFMDDQDESIFYPIDFINYITIINDFFLEKTLIKIRYICKISNGFLIPTIKSSKFNYVIPNVIQWIYTIGDFGMFFNDEIYDDDQIIIEEVYDILLETHEMQKEDIILFGSMFTGLTIYCIDDIDISIQISTTSLQKIYKKLQNDNEIKELTIIENTKVPIIKFKYKSYNIDVSMNNNEGIHNSKHINRLLDKLPSNVRTLIKIYKFWLKDRQINSVINNGMSSYAFTLLIFTFFKHMYNFDLFYYQTDNEIKKITEYFLTNDVKDIFLDLLGYHIYLFNYLHKNGGTITLNGIEESKYKEIYFYDPFEKDFNLARRLSKEMSMEISNAASKSLYDNY